MFILGFYIKLQLYAFKVVQETLQNKLIGKIKSNQIKSNKRSVTI